MAALSALVLVALTLGLAQPALGAAPTVLWERNVSPDILHLAYPRNDAFDPIVATHPTDPNKLAVLYHYKPKKGAGCGVVTGLRISTDGGDSWHEAPRRPWAGSGRYPNWHGTLAWGPGPQPGSGRLYWADTTVNTCSFNDHRLSVAYSDDLGASWSPLFVYRGVPATSAGGYPEIAVDRNPASPNYGAVYAAINWFSSLGAEPGYRVIASSDFGKHWTSREVPLLNNEPGYPFSYRIGYRLRSAPDGHVYATFCQRDRRSRTGATGRLAYGIARLNLSANELTGGQPKLAITLQRNGYNLGTKFAPGSGNYEALNACWSHGIDIDADGTVHLAVSNYRKSVDAGAARGVIRYGRSNDGGDSWDWQSLPSLPPVNGRGQTSFRPTLVASGETVFVGLHVMTDVPLGSGRTPVVTIGNAYSVSHDGGASFSTPALISEARWNPDWLDYSRNGPGLRDRAELTAAGRVFYGYGDGRHGAPYPNAHWGRGQVYAALIDPGGP
jgi:hypothetical protein